MADFTESLWAIYVLHVLGGGVPIGALESRLGAAHAIDNFEDLRRNEKETYVELFLESSNELEGLLCGLLGDMRDRPFADCNELIDAAAFIQLVAATALWKHRISVGTLLEKFAREFDRLDTVEERRRLHDVAHSEQCWCEQAGR
jgi:hypothetical protein